MTFTIYYRGQHITVVNAKTQAAALKAYFKLYTKGTKGTTVAVPETCTAAEHQTAIAKSLEIPSA